MIGYIVVEPSLRIERVPDHLLEWEDLLWPAESNTLPETRSGQPTPTFAAKDLYHRHNLADSDTVVYVWSRRDANALPEPITATIRERAKIDAPRR